MCTTRHTQAANIAQVQHTQNSLLYMWMHSERWWGRQNCSNASDQAFSSSSNALRAAGGDKQLEFIGSYLTSSLTLKIINASLLKKCNQTLPNCCIIGPGRCFIHWWYGSSKASETVPPDAEHVNYFGSSVCDGP